MEIPYNSNTNEYSKQFMPIWKKYILFGKISGLVWALFLISAAFIPSSRDLLGKIFPFLFFVTLAWALYFQLIRVRCTKCGLRIASLEFYVSRFTLTGKCPNCDTQLKPRILSERMATIIPIVFFIIVFLTIIIAGITWKIIKH